MLVTKQNPKIGTITTPTTAITDTQKITTLIFYLNKKLKKILFSGANFGASEARDGYNTNGEYHVALPDGRTQTVTYTADGNGYIADVKYTGEAVYAPAPAYAPAPVKPYAPAPVVVPAPAPVVVAHAPAPLLAAAPIFRPAPLPLRPAFVGRPLLG